MNPPSPILASLQRLAASRKAQMAAGSVVAVVLTRILGKLGLTPEDVNYISGAIVAGAASVILGTAHEDASAKSVTQQNIGSEVTNNPPAVDPAKIAAAMADANEPPKGNAP